MSNPKSLGNSRTYNRESKTIVELQEATGLKRRTTESDQYFRQRLMLKANTLDDDAWGKLSSKTRRWVWKATAAHNKGKPMPPTEDDKAAVEAHKAKLAKGAENRIANQALGKSGTQMVHELMLEHGFDLQVEQIASILEGHGYKYTKSTIVLAKNELRRVVRTLHENGWLKNNVKGFVEEQLSSAPKTRLGKPLRSERDDDNGLGDREGTS